MLWRFSLLGLGLGVLLLLSLLLLLLLLLLLIVMMMSLLLLLLAFLLLLRNDVVLDLVTLLVVGMIGLHPAMATPAPPPDFFDDDFKMVMK